MPVRSCENALECDPTVSDQTEQTKCPTEEELSAWYDAQAEDPEMEAHVAVCPRCKELIGSYETIDLGVRHTIKKVGSPADAKHITQTSIEKIRLDDEKTGKRRTTFRVVVVLAIAAAVLGLIAFLYHRSQQSLQQRGSGAKGIAGDGVAVNLSQVKVLGVADTPDERNALIKLAGDGSVKQEWSVSDPALALTDVKDLLAPETHATLDTIALTKADRCSLLLELSRDELQYFVDQLDRRGYRLLSADGPQPGTLHWSAGSETVRYHAEFVRQE